MDYSQVTQRLDRHEERLDGHDRDIADISRHIATLRGDITELRTTVAGVAIKEEIRHEEQMDKLDEISADVKVRITDALKATPAQVRIVLEVLSVVAALTLAAVEALHHFPHL